nr:MAG TPA: hypothetical protein [Caudoviricetes sp.]
MDVYILSSQPLLLDFMTKLPSGFTFVTTPTCPFAG